jgi:hypothetical protein
MATLTTTKMTGWAEINSEGLSTVYLSIVDEGFMTVGTDTPANTQFRPRILNAESFSIKRSPAVWPQQSSGIQGAAFGQLQIDNYDGAFDFLISADLRDATVVLKLTTATPLGSATQFSSSFLFCTGVIDAVSCDNEDIITLTLKDTIARLDRTLPCRYNAPFVDANAANNMIPIALGAIRNGAPQLIDSPTITYRLADSQVANIIEVCDKAAPLDPHAAPPQYTPTLSGTGLKLQAMPVGKLTWSGNSVGQQSIIPGISDILAGAGAFPNPWGGVMVGGASTTVGSVSNSGPGVTWIVAVDDAGPFAVGMFVRITDGVNSIVGPISSINYITQELDLTQSQCVTTGTPTSIGGGSPVTQTDTPTSFTWSNGAGSVIAQVLNPPNAYVGTYIGARLFSTIVFNPAGGKFGDQLYTTTAILQPGVTYRLTFSYNAVASCPPYFSGGMQGGLMVATGLSTAAQDYITGISSPLTTPAFQAQNYTLEFTVPAGAARKLYFLAVPSSGNAANTAQGTVSVVIFNVLLEQLGQFGPAGPLSGITMTDYFTEILINRAGEATTVFNHNDTDLLAIRDIDTPDGAAGTLIPFGQVFTTPPSILDALHMGLDNFCGTIFTDAAGTIRSRRLTDPSDPVGRVVVADFDTSNVVRPIAVRSDPAQYLTTLFGARRNWSVFSASDFVTDQAIVSQDEKARYMRTSQYVLRSTKIPAGEYNFAIAAPQFDTTIDIANDCQIEADRVVGIWSPNVYSDGTFNTGKRRLVTFTALYDDPAAVGVTITAAVTSIQFNDVIKFTYTAHGFNSAYGAVLEWELFPFANKVIYTVMI